MTALRRAGPSDIEAIARLEAACFGEQDGVFSRRQLRALLNNPNAFWLIDDRGLAMACWLKAANGKSRWARMYSLAVHPSIRGTGVGRQLVAAGMVWMKQQGLLVCRAEVKKDNHTARRLYASFGFTEGEYLRNYYANGADGLRLRKTI